MALQTVFWPLFMAAVFATIFVIVPPEQRREFLKVGFWLGLGQAVFYFWLGQPYFQFFRIVGDPTLFGIPVFASLSWVPAVILFAYYFSTVGTPVKRAVLILVFASGAVVAQYSLELLGMWQSLNWNLGYTFLLAVAAHMIISVYLLASRHMLKT